MNDVIGILLQWLIPFICGGILSAVGAVLAGCRSKQKRQSAIESGVQCLLRGEIVRSCEGYLDKKCCPVYAKETLQKAYTAYHNLGGNDVATGLYDQAMELPSECR